MKDLKGKLIIQTPKSSKSVEIDGTSLFAGHRFLLKTKLYGDKRCIYCGKWFHWKDTDYHSWIKSNNIDTTNVDDVLEPLHCGSAHCEEYHRRYLKHQELIKKEEEADLDRKINVLFKKLKKEGLIR